MNNTAKNYMLTQLTGQATRASLHAVNGTEITGGDYARQAVTWGTATNGAITASNQPAFSVPASSVVAIVKLWNTAGDTEYASFSVTSETFANAGTYTITSLSLDLNK